MSTVETQGYRVERYDRFCIIQILPEMNNLAWTNIEQGGTNLISLLDEYDPPRFVVDLTSLNYMGSALVALIVRLWKTVKDSPGEMVVINSNEMVGEVLNLAGLTSVWKMAKTEAEGLKLLGVKKTPVKTAGQSDGKLKMFLLVILLLALGLGVGVGVGMLINQ